MASRRAPAEPPSPAADLDLLVVFAVIARERSFTRAAAALGISQPSVSQRVRRLERRIGEPVFERLGRGVRLTRTGEALLPLADQALAIARDTTELLAGIGGLERGVVRCAASTTIAGYVLPRAIARLREARPQVEVEVRVGNTAEVAEAVERGDVPWGLVEGPVDEARLAARPFMQDELILVVPAHHPWARRRRVSPEMLEREAFIGREPGSGTGAIYERALAARGIRLRPRVRLADSRGIVAAVADGAGVAIVSALVAAPMLDTRRVARVAIAGLDLARPLRFVQRPGRGTGRLDDELLRAVGAHPPRRPARRSATP